MIINNSKDNLTIASVLRVKESKKFYSFSILEITNQHGNILKQETNRLYHSSIKKLEQGHYVFILESFDREFKSRQHSTTEKVFLSNIEFINNRIELQTNNFCKFDTIRNLPELQKKLETRLDKLSKTYKGRHANNAFVILRKTYSDPLLVAREIIKRENWGLLLNPYFGEYNMQTVKTNTLVNRNLLQDTYLEIEEQARLKHVDPQQDELVIEVQGKIVEPINEELFTMSMDFLQIPYQQKTDKPRLDKYEGLYIFYSETGEVKNASLSILFSYGKNYTKTINYTLKEVSHEEI